jgi:hypothetical protein
VVPFYDTDLGPVMRLRPPRDVVDESVEQGARDFMFYDDDFGLSRQSDQSWALAFREEIMRRKIVFHWGVELRVTDVIRGANHISIGMESVLPRQLALYNKGYQQSQIFRALEITQTATQPQPMLAGPASMSPGSSGCAPPHHEPPPRRAAADVPRTAGTSTRGAGVLACGAPSAVTSRPP